MQKRRFIFFISTFCAFIIITFFPLASNTQEEFTIKKVDGVEVVSNPKQPVPKEGSRKRLVFEEDLTIGSVDGEKNSMFGGLICFNTDDDGNFYVSDTKALRIQKYSPQGEYLLTIGREGQGPGEFRSLSVVRFDKNDNLFICDVTGRKVSFFNKEGKFLKQIKMPGSYENLYINSKGLMIASKYEQIPSENALTMISTAELFDQDFKPLAEIHKIQREMPLPGKDLSSRVQIMANMISLTAFKPQEFLTLAENDLIYFGYPEKYEINIASPEGKLVKKITREYDPVPVREKDRENFEDMMSQEETFTNMPDDTRKKIFQLIKYPEYKPAYQSFTLIKSGLHQSFALMENGWLALIADHVEGEYSIFDLFDREGRYVGKFKTTIPVEGLFFNNGKAYAIATEEGYRFVKRYKFKIEKY